MGPMRAALLSIAIVGACSGPPRDPASQPPAPTGTGAPQAPSAVDGGAADPAIAAPPVVTVDPSASDAGPATDAKAADDAHGTFRMASPPEPTAFAFDPAADTSGTARSGEVELSPRVLVALLGAPYVSDGTKVSGQYTFKGGKHVFTVYEWESTQNSGEGCGPMPAVFWMTDRPYAFHIGGPRDATQDDVRVFEAWLRAQVSTMLRKRHAREIAALERLVAQLHDKAVTPAKAAASARALRAKWRLGPVPAKKVSQPLVHGGGRPEGFDNWNSGGGRECDPFVVDESDGSRRKPAFAVGREDPRSIWQEVLRALVEDTDLTTEAVAGLRTFLAAKPGEEWNAWEVYWPTR